MGKFQTSVNCNFFLFRNPYHCHFTSFSVGICEQKLTKFLRSQVYFVRYYLYLQRISQKTDSITPGFTTLRTTISRSFLTRIWRRMKAKSTSFTSMAFCYWWWLFWGLWAHWCLLWCYWNLGYETSFRGFSRHCLFVTLCFLFWPFPSLGFQLYQRGK